MLINCKECNHHISSEAVKCPYCGAPAPMSQGVALFTVVGICGIIYAFYHFWSKLHGN